MEIVAQQLKRQSCGVIHRDIVTDDREDQDDEAEFSETERMEGRQKEATNSMIFIYRTVRRICTWKVSKAGTDGRNKYGWDADTHDGEKEYFPRLGGCWVVTIVITRFWQVRRVHVVIGEFLPIEHHPEADEKHTAKKLSQFPESSRPEASDGSDVSSLGPIWAMRMIKSIAVTIQEYFSHWWIILKPKIDIT